MSKILLKIGGLVAVFALLLGGVAQAAAMPRRSTPQSATPPTGETRTMVVAGISFALMIGTAGAVLWYTARGRRHTE